MKQNMTYIAGIGCRQAAKADDILAVVPLALACNGLEQSALSALACIPAREDHPGIREAVATLGLRLVTADAKALAHVADRCITRSDASLAATGLPSASEAAALAVADAMAGDKTSTRLMGPRNAMAMATCAIASLQAPSDHLDQQ